MQKKKKDQWGWLRSKDSRASQKGLRQIEVSMPYVWDPALGKVTLCLSVSLILDGKQPFEELFIKLIFMI